MPEDANTEKRGTVEEIKRENEEDSFKIPFKLTLDKRIDLAIMGVIVFLGVFMVFEARGISIGTIPDPITSRGMPYIAGISFIILGIVLGIARVKTWSDLPGNLVLGEGHEDEEGHQTSWGRVAVIFLATWLSVELLNSLGYLIVMPLFLFVVIWTMGTRTLGKCILFPILFTVITWYIFSQPLKFKLPLGFLTPYFRSLGLTL